MKDVYVEWLIKKKQSVTDKVLRIGTKVITAFIFLIALGTFDTKMLIAGVVATVITYFVHHYTSIEFEYIYITGELGVDRILARSMRKRILNIEPHEIEVVAPLNSSKVDAYKNRPFKEFNFTSGDKNKKSPIFVVYCNNGNKVLFEPNREMVEAMRADMPHKVFMDL